MEIATIDVEVIRVTWPRDPAQENPRRWYRLECLANGGALACSGNIEWRPAERDLLKLTGRYNTWKGQRVFEFREARPRLPEQPRALLAYVVERTCGMGPAAEAAIWDRFGEGWQKITAAEAKTLKIRAEVFEEFREQVEKMRHDRERAETIAWLTDCGCSAAMAAAAWERWEESAPGVVNEDCYRLAELKNFGFWDVDRKVRHAFGIGDTDRRRLRAAILYAMKQRTAGGSTVAAWTDLAADLAGMQVDVREAAFVTAGMFGGELVSFPDEQRIALARHYNAEIEILKLIEENHEFYTGSIPD